MVPPDRLSPDALIGVVDAFVLQEGTDYGHDEHTLEEKRNDVLAQIRRGEVVIVFDPKTEAVTLALARDVPR